jgi:MoxR-like ATPase
MNLEQILTIAMLVPMTGDDPSDPATQWGLPLLLEGSPGIGKSGRIKQVARAVGLDPKVVLASTRQPEDFSGAPFKNRNDEITIECILPAINQLVKKERGLLFLDEISCARPAVQGALLGVVYDRAVGDTMLPGGVRVMAAANPAEEAAGGWNLAPPLANRFAWLKVKTPEAREWAEWLMNGSPRLAPLEDGEDRLKNAWGRVWPKVRALGAQFVQSDPGILYALPAEDDPERHRAWPSPRTWEFALRAVAACQALGKPELQFDFVKACVGEGAATEFAGWLTDKDLPDPEDMLRNGWAPDTARLDVSIAALGALAAFIKSHPKGKQRDAYAVKAWQLLDAASKAGMADGIVVPSGVLINEGYAMSASDELKQVAQPVMAKVHALGMKRGR